MRLKHFILTATAAALFLQTPAQAQNTPRPEYPRPQFERSEWVNLNGTWSYTFDFGRSGEERLLRESTNLGGEILVPFCPESKLSGVQHTDFINTIWYQRTISIPADWKDRLVILHFGAVDYAATIFIDGRKVTTHYGSGSSFSVDITRYVTPGKDANLVLCVDDNIRSGRQPVGKQSQEYYSAGCCYTRVTGIWQTVWMEPVAPNGLKQVSAVPDIDQQQLVISPEFYQENPANTLTVEMSDGKKTVASKTVKCGNHSTIVLPVKNPKLWSPESPFLYDLTYTVKDASGQVIDRISSYTGMRKVHVADGYFYLNNQPYFQRLVLDQGFYPEGIWTAPSDEALKHDIEMSKAVGFNGARLHQKVFEERYYYWADRLGYITWGEQGNWGMDVNNEEAARNFISEWAEIVVRDRNHPSLVTWTPFNETWGCSDTGVYARMMRDVYFLTKAIDPTRPVNDVSGDGHILTDIWSVHDYSRTKDELIEHHTIKSGVEPFRNQPKKKFLDTYNGQPYMLDEFGGLPWIKESDRSSSWGYGSNIDSIEEFYRILEDQLDAIIACKHITGYCYTQITDVEQEKNGIYEYDRTPKFDTERLRSIFAKIPSVIKDPQDLSDWK